MIGHSLSFSCLKKKGLAYGDFEGRIRPEANCSSTQRFISTISCRVSEYSLEVRCPGSVLNSILISKSGREQGSSSHFASLKTDGYRLGQSGVGPDLEKRVSGILAEARVLAFGGVGWQCGREGQPLGQRESLASAFGQSISGLCRFNQSCPRITMWDRVFPSRKWIHSWWSPTLTSKSMPNWIFPSLFCIPSTLYIVIGFHRGAGSSPTLFAHSKSIKQLVQPESIRAFIVAPFTVLRASRCTWMESSHGMQDSASFSTFVRHFIGSTFLLATVSFLSISSASIQVCLHCKIVYFGVLAVDTGTGRGLGYLLLRHQFGLTGPHLQNPAEAPVWTHWASSPKSCGLGICGPMSGRGHRRDPPPWHHQHWWDAAWREGQGCRPVAGPGEVEGQGPGHGAVLLGQSGFGGRGDSWLWAEPGAQSFAVQ